MLPLLSINLKNIHNSFATEKHILWICFIFSNIHSCRGSASGEKSDFCKHIHPKERTVPERYQLIFKRHRISCWHIFLQDTDIQMTEKGLFSIKGRSKKIDLNKGGSGSPKFPKICVLALRTIFMTKIDKKSPQCTKREGGHWFRTKS